MELEISLVAAAAMLVVGLLAGVINTLAGGGSNLTLPVLMVLGLPADVANATNRVAVTLHGAVATAEFHRNRRLDVAGAPAILGYTLVGGLVGAAMASWMPVWLLKPVLLGTMLTMATILLVRPDVVAPPPGTPLVPLAESRNAKWLLLFAGVYGGFVQAGVGFVLLAALCGSMRYDLVRGNALKVLCTLAFTLVALAVFALRGQVWWWHGLVLALGTMAGAWLGVRLALRLPHHTMKWFLFTMTVAACSVALLTD